MLIFGRVLLYYSKLPAGLMAYQTEMLPEDIWGANHVIFCSLVVSEMGPVSCTWTQLTEIVQGISFGFSIIWGWAWSDCSGGCRYHRCTDSSTGCLVLIGWTRVDEALTAFPFSASFFLFSEAPQHVTLRKNIFQSSFPAGVWAQDADAKGERANKPVRTKAPINGWNIKDKTDKSFQKACFRILLLQKNWRVFFPVQPCASVRLPLWVGELGAISIWHRFSLTENCQLHCSWTYLKKPNVRFLCCCEANMKTPCYYWIFSRASEFVPFFSQNDQVSTKEFQKYDIDPDRSDS